MAAQPFIVPTREQYLAVLPKLWSGIPKNHMKMLKHNVTSPNCATTATLLGQAAGYTKLPAQSANLQYGLLGKKIGLALGMTFDTYKKTGDPILTSAIGNIIRNRSVDPGDWMIVMHHTLADALRELNLW